MVLDRVTGLLWEQKRPPTRAGCSGEEGRCKWEEAKAYCEHLELAGLRWRLPTKIELESLVDETRLKPNVKDGASIDVEYFPGTPQDYFWTASETLALGDEDAICVSFAGGFTNTAPTFMPYEVRCVRSELRVAGVPSERYQPHDDDTIEDLRTRLIWQRSPSEGSLDFAGAEAYCHGLGNDFRLPTLKELSTLFDPAGVIPGGRILPRQPSVPLIFYPTAPQDRQVIVAYWTTSLSLLSVGEHYLEVLDLGFNCPLKYVMLLSEAIGSPYTTRGVVRAVRAWGCAALLLAACASDAPATQVVIEVAGDASLLARLRDVRAFVYAPDEADANRPVRQYSFARFSKDGVFPPSRLQ